MVVIDCQWLRLERWFNLLVDKHSVVHYTILCFVVLFSFIYSKLCSQDKSRVHLTLNFFSQKQIYLLFEIPLRKYFLIQINLWFPCPNEISKKAPQHYHFSFTTESEENGSSGCCEVYPGKSNISCLLIFLGMMQYILFQKCADTFQRCYRLLYQYPRFN